jgi:hypothetical protein
VGLKGSCLLGSQLATFQIDKPLQVSTVEKPFTWVITPHHADRKKFKYVSIVPNDAMSRF